MTRPNSSLAVSLFVTIAIGSGVFGAATIAQACPLRDAGVSSRSSSSGELTGPNRMNGSNDALRRSDLSSSSEIGLPLNSNLRADLRRAELAGFITIAGALMVGVVYKLRQRGAGQPEMALVDYPEIDHPEFEHPELALAALPKEALPFAAIDREVTSTR